MIVFVDLKIQQIQKNLKKLRAVEKFAGQNFAGQKFAG
jgi:hypothetical protein